ncbi:helix-hairpin-helix domain-containing protein [Pseudalkalibacillus sp. SCS-8]|uniref:helix-hairpin-helix domain-containing protein n=1 Tax=Pseudalkalibacillus nanhaiensis TaxID=3115291 RepID=UPI0032DAD2B7
MGKITNKGKVWEWRNSIWMLWALLTFGFLNYVSFYYISYRVQQRKWAISGIVYSIIFIIAIATVDLVPEEHWLSDVTIGAYLLGWIVSIIHVFRARTEYLIRLEARHTYGQQELKILKTRIKQEYTSEGFDGSFENSMPHVEGNLQHDSDNTIVVNLNEGTEEEIANVPGIGGLFAKKVVAVRQQEGGFRSFDHFVQALSIKPHLVEKIRPHVVLPSPGRSEPQHKPAGRIVDY